MLWARTRLNSLILGALLVALVSGILFEPLASAQTGTTRRVDPSATGIGDGSSWENAFTSLQAAIAASSNNDSIWIRSGTYKPSTGSDRAASFVIGASVTLYGGFAGFEEFLHERDIAANPTILSGDLNGDDTAGFGNRGDNSYHIVWIDDVVGTPVILDGLIIRGGNADGAGVLDRLGAGVFIFDPSGGSAVRVLIREGSRLEDCSALVAGAGLSGVSYSVSEPSELDYFAPGAELRDVLFAGNRSGGATLARFEGRGAASLGFLRATQARFEGNVCEGCDGGAVSIELRDGPIEPPDPEEWSVLVSVEFVENAAIDGSRLLGGGLACIWGARLANCLFARNTVGSDAQTANGFGGGMYAAERVEVVNCTFAENLAHNEEVIGNSAPGIGGGLHLDGVTDVRIRNGVFWGNRVDDGSDLADSQFAQTTATPSGSLASSTIAYSLIENYEPPGLGPDYRILGDDLVLHDPLFADPASDNYRHRSIWITDFGDDDSLPDDENDMDNDTMLAEPLPLDLRRGERVRSSAVDVGAYEWCIGDLNGDGVVDGADLGQILGLSGECSGTAPCLGDLDGDGDVDGGDLGILLGNWECGAEAESLLLGGDRVEALLTALGLETIEELWVLLLELGPEEGAELVVGSM